MIINILFKLEKVENKYFRHLSLAFIILQQAAKSDIMTDLFCWLRNSQLLTCLINKFAPQEHASMKTVSIIYSLYFTKLLCTYLVFISTTFAFNEISCNLKHPHEVLKVKHKLFLFLK